MKVAVCLAGQYRTFDNPIVQRTLNHFLLEKYDCDVFVSTWDDTGRSVNNTQDTSSPNRKVQESHILQYLPKAVVEVENYKEWYNSLPQQLRAYIDATTLHSGCVPQLYKKYKAVALIPKEAQYDVVIVTRPDLFYLEELPLSSIKETTGTIWNSNPVGTWAYYPNRIFDIMYMGVRESVDALSQCYFNIDKLLDDPHQTGLHSLDCCKMLYTFAKDFCNLQVQSTTTLIGNVYRDDSSVQYNCLNCGIDLEDYIRKIENK